MWMNCFPGLSTGGKNTHNLKVENYVLFDRRSEDNKPGKQTASQITQRPCSEVVRGQPGQTGIFQNKKKMKHQKMTVN